MLLLHVDRLVINFINKILQFVIDRIPFHGSGYMLDAQVDGERSIGNTYVPRSNLE